MQLDQRAAPLARGAEWFYNGREHWADELEEAIDEVMTTDFNAQIEDGSQTEVADKLVQVREAWATLRSGGRAQA